MPVLSRVELCNFLPHGNEMCLLTSVEDWDTTSIICLTSTHRNYDNPLLQQGYLKMLSGLEYAAQAMGIHVGLTRDISKHNASVGYLGAIRDVRVHSPSFQQFSEDLTIEAQLILEQGLSFIYSFTVQASEKPLLEGRASIFIQKAEIHA